MEKINQAMSYLDFTFKVHPFQKDVIEHYMSGRDCFCIAGTGAGKSLTYILCPIVMDLCKNILPSESDDKTYILHHVTIIIQPLKALMKSQRDKLASNGLKTIYLGDEDASTSIKELRDGKYNYIIASPESATSAKFLDEIFKIRSKIACVFIDESHCIQTL
jgi:superfamily II DNA helicase RecQ